ncbi:MAG: hypothetical protein AB7G48_15900 [Nitrospiraceae bacterium]
MFQEERSFVLRFSIEAQFPDDYEGHEEEYHWLRDWEGRVKPEVLKTLFETLRRFPEWSVHVRNRGHSPLDQVEVVVQKDFTKRLSL